MNYLLDLALGDLAGYSRGKSQQEKKFKKKKNKQESEEYAKT